MKHSSLQWLHSKWNNNCFHHLFFNWHLTSTPFSAPNYTSTPPKQNIFHMQNAKMSKLFPAVQNCELSAARTLSGLHSILILYAETPDLPSIEGVQTGISVNEDSPSKVKKL